MFFWRITGFPFCFQWRLSTLLKCYFSWDSISRKEIDSWGTTHSGNCGLVPDCAGISISSLQFILTTWMQWENLSAQGLMEKGGKQTSWHQETSFHREKECPCSGASMKCCRSEANIHLKFQQVTWTMFRLAWLNRTFQKLSRTNSQEFSYPVLVKEV